MSAQNWPEWSHKLVARKTRGEETITVTAGLHYIEGNSKPYFSITADIRDRYGESGGCQHERVLEYWPELAPVVALHMADDDGKPMYAKENGWYWLAGYYGGAGERYHGAGGSDAKDPEECLGIFAAHVRVPVSEARQYAANWSAGVPYAAKRLFCDWVDGQTARWRAEAKAAMQLLNRLARGIVK